jgi:two-component system CheB/CheR fusion protein
MPNQTKPNQVKKPVAAETASLFRVVGIGGSAGGLEAFLELLKNLPSDPGMAFVFILHLAPGVKSMLVELFERKTLMPVLVIKNGLQLKINTVYVIAPATNIKISNGIFIITKQTELRHLPVDMFFASLAKEYKTRSVGVVLSGTAKDGSAGIKYIKDAGGSTFVQDEETAKFPEMPRNARISGKVDYILSPKDIALKLCQLALTSVKPLPPSGLLKKQSICSSTNLQDVFSLLYRSKNINFAHYKLPTVLRRIKRRLNILKLDNISNYLSYLQIHKEEVANLYNDLLINITGFFRDSEVFRELKDRLLPFILKGKKNNQHVRIWVPACSTGEEVYSLAICLLEIIGKKEAKITVQIFATDINAKNINIARAGVYGKNAVKTVSSERLKKYFYKEGADFRVCKKLREMCIFSTQNVITDAPFSNIDLLSCRNLLIYLEAAAQKKVFRNIYYALRPGGILILGKSETTSAFAGGFKTKNRRKGVFEKKQMSTGLNVQFNAENIVSDSQAQSVSAPWSRREDTGFNTKTESLEAKVNRVVSRGYFFSGVLLNSSLEVLFFRGATGRYLESSEGAPSLSIFKIAREGLFLPLRSALKKAGKTKKVVRAWAERVKFEDGFIRVYLTVLPVQTEGVKEMEYMVIFDEIEETNDELFPLKKSNTLLKANSRLRIVEKELTETKEYLKTVIEEHEEVKERMKVAGEEILSSNEELQSTNEELETSKEELQSSNEELITSNEELQHRSSDASLYNNDLENLLKSINMPVIIVGSDYKVRRITSQCENAVGLFSSDLGRMLTRTKMKIEFGNLEKLLSDSLERLLISHMEVVNSDGNWYKVEIKPYRTLDNKIDGIIMIFSDISEEKRLQQKAFRAHVYADSIVENIGIPLLVLDRQMKVLLINAQYCFKYQGSSQETVGRNFYIIDNEKWNIPLLKKRLNELGAGGEDFMDYELKCNFQIGGEKTLLFSARRLSSSDRILLSIIDITERRKLEENLFQARKMEAVGTLTAGIAHDFNNMLSVIIGYSDISMKVAGEKPELRKNIEEIKKAAGRGAALINQLLAFSRKQSILRTGFSLNAALVDLSHIIKNIVGAGVEYEFSPAPNLKPVYADRSQIDQIIINLVSNAKNAMPKGGKLKIKTETLTLTQKESSEIPDSAPGEYCCLTVKDTGIGVDSENMKHIFEPFYTTKPFGKGSGLGLSVVYGILKQQKGWINIYSKKGEGTEAKVFLQTLKENQVADSVAIEAEKAFLGGARERILVVDDDKEIGGLVSSILENNNYVVFKAASGEEALEIFKKEKCRIDLLFSDSVMQGISGLVLAEKIKVLNPEVKVIISSGYFDEQSEIAGVQKSGYSFLPKPYDMKKMLLEVSKVLNQIKEPKK